MLADWSLLALAAPPVRDAGRLQRGVGWRPGARRRRVHRVRGDRHGVGLFAMAAMGTRVLGGRYVLGRAGWRRCGGQPMRCWAARWR